MLDEENLVENADVTPSQDVQDDENKIISTESDEPSQDDSKKEVDEKDDGNEEDSSDQDQAKNFEAVDWVKKRLAQKDRQAKKHLKEKEKEIEYLRQQVSAIYQPSQSSYSPPAGQIYDPVSGQYVDEDSVDGKVLKKIQDLQQVEIMQQQAREFQSKQHSLANKIDELKDKYDDLEDVFKKSEKNITYSMGQMMLNYPDSVETFYELARNNPERLEEISKMPDHQQTRALHFLEFQKANNIQQKVKSNAPKPVTPVKTSSTTHFVDENSYEAILERQREELKRQFGG